MIIHTLIPAVMIIEGFFFSKSEFEPESTRWSVNHHTTQTNWWIPVPKENTSARSFDHNHNEHSRYRLIKASFISKFFWVRQVENILFTLQNQPGILECPYIYWSYFNLLRMLIRYSTLRMVKTLPAHTKWSAEETLNDGICVYRRVLHRSF